MRYRLQDGWELKPFQKEGVRKIHAFGGRCLLADQMGTGKTIQSLTWIARTDIRPALVVCPASMKFTWRHEAMEKYGIQFKVLSGRNPDDIDIHGDFAIINYDIFQHWESAIKRWGPKILVMDEAHYIKNQSAKRSKSIKRVSRDCKSVLALSGTPFTNYPYELWNILHVVNQEIFPSSRDYAFRYCQPRFHPKAGWQYRGATRMPELFQILNDRVMVRRLKKDVLHELPDKIRKIIWMRADAAGRKTYAKADKAFLDWLAEKSVSKAKKASKNETLVKIGYLLRLASELKEDQSIAWITEFFEANPERKLVAFSMHRRMIDKVHKAFPRTSVVIDGSVSMEKRNTAVTKFQTSKETKLFIGQVKAAGEGLTLTKASDVVFLDLPWNPAQVVQAEDRIHRIGQENDCTIYYHILEDSMEVKVSKMIQKKADAFSKAIDGEEFASPFEELTKK